MKQIILLLIACILFSCNSQQSVEEIQENTYSDTVKIELAKLQTFIKEMTPVATPAFITNKYFKEYNYQILFPEIEETELSAIRYCDLFLHQTIDNQDSTNYIYILSTESIKDSIKTENVIAAWVYPKIN